MRYDAIIIHPGQWASPPSFGKCRVPGFLFAQLLHRPSEEPSETPLEE
jgi:hypothetical protein